MRNVIKTCFIVAVMLVSIMAPAFAAESTAQLTGEVAYIASEGGFYGIIGDDGRRYQPSNLPRNFRKAGLPVVFTFVERTGTFSTLMWGTIIDIKSINNVGATMTGAERAAVQLLLKRMAAFNDKSLEKLQQIDTVSQSLSNEQFHDWVSNYSNFTLHYVEAEYIDHYTITGFCLYTREQVNSISLKNNANMAAMQFTLSLKKDGWKLTESSNLYVPYTLSEIVVKAKQKYGTDDLSSVFANK